MTPQHSSHRLRLAVALLLIFVFGFVTGVAVDRHTVSDIIQACTVPRKAVPDFRLMAEAWNTIQHHYVDRAAIKPRRIAYGAIAGMVNSLGDTDHSTFLTPNMVHEERESLRGQFAGIGVEVQMKNRRLVIVAPIDGSPAQKAGLQAGDVILEVNGKNIGGQPINKVVGEIKGPPGTHVSLTVLNPKTGKLRQYHLVRAHIRLSSVTWQMLPGTHIAHVRIALFSKGTAKALAKALDAAQAQGARAVILDLRNDPGGLFDEAIDTASLFIQNGNVLLEKNVHGQIHSVPVRPGPPKFMLPMEVLVNSGTASAAEIVAGALRDAGRAKLVGQTTFGTGTVLESYPLSDGSALVLAVQEWLTPHGHSFWHHGITPNYVVALPAGVSPLQPEAERGMTPQALRRSRDTQLLRAVGLLSAHPHPRHS
ncbi:MAG: S41 family peptidase [Gammaproteobacteria bacterium]|nr:S41 family peptidase [Gammaproteobacteria bacterium]